VSDTVDLSGVSALQGVSSAVEFRIYVWGESSKFSATMLGDATFSGESTGN